MNLLVTYRKFFIQLEKWAFATATAQFLVFMFVFILLCFCFTLISVPDDSSPEHEIFISKFEKYLILASAVLLLFPFLASLILTFALLHQYDKLQDLWVKVSVVFSPFYTLGLLSTGIYLAVEGSYIGYITIVMSLLLGAFMGHSILIIYFLNHDPAVNSQVNDKNSDE